MRSRCGILPMRGMLIRILCRLDRCEYNYRSTIACWMAWRTGSSGGYLKLVAVSREACGFEEATGLEPTRLGCVRVDVLKVDHARCAFDHAHGEFNVARFTRDLASGKVAKKLGDELPPNQLRVAVVGAQNLKAQNAFAVVTVRLSVPRRPCGRSLMGAASGTSAFLFRAPDPSARGSTWASTIAGRGLSSF